MEDFKKNILELNRLCKKKNALLVLISPPLCKEKSHEWGRTEHIILYRKELENISTEYQIPLIIIKEMTEQSEFSTMKFFNDTVHPNRLGHTVIMKKLYDYFIANKILPLKRE